ncbi:MAG: response regulator transcription factor [Actinobacteria bacterium]|nr:response regulator transcription factor [Actinomycetota bacterium]
MTAERCPVCDATPRVVVAVAHPLMRRLIADLLGSSHDCWEVTLAEPGELASLPAGTDLAVVDASSFPRCCASPGCLPRSHYIVIAPERDETYSASASRQGAGGWLARDTVAEELERRLRDALGCRHHPCPPRRPEAPTV